MRATVPAAGGELVELRGRRSPVRLPLGAEGAVSAGRAAAAFPKTSRLVGTTRTGSPADVAVGEESVWVANADGTVSRIDPATGDVVKTIRVGGSPVGIAVGEGVVWVTVD